MNNILLGVICLDIYTNTDLIRPGCGLLHNAFHLQNLGCNPLLITRIGTERREIFEDFFHHNNITVLPNTIVQQGVPASIEIAVQDSGEAVMSNFVRGVWDNFQLGDAEKQKLAQANNVHTVLVDGIVEEFARVSSSDLLKNTCVSADFLSFKDFSIDIFEHLLQHLDIAFIGWKGSLSDPLIAEIEQVARRHKALVVITLGERGIQVFDSRQPDTFQSPFFEVEPVAVKGNTNGCGDAFISYFLAGYWRNHNLEQAITHGKTGGALATNWSFALPDTAYRIRSNNV